MEVLAKRKDYNKFLKFKKFFEISTKLHFVSLFCLNERNTATSLLTIHLKCAAVHYANQIQAP